jgi:hypothetical protein
MVMGYAKNGIIPLHVLAVISRLPSKDVNPSPFEPMKISLVQGKPESGN